MKTGQKSMALDAPWKPRGIGGGHRWLCGECQQPRTTTAGSKKIKGVKVCAECVAAAAAGKATA